MDRVSFKMRSYSTNILYKKAENKLSSSNFNNVSLGSLFCVVFLFVSLNIEFSKSALALLIRWKVHFSNAIVGESQCFV